MAAFDIVGFIDSVGFPIAISIYLLLTRDKIISTNTAALGSLKESIDILSAVHTSSQAPIQAKTPALQPITPPPAPSLEETFLEKANLN